MVIDASAIIEMLAGEVDADEFADTLAAASMRLAPAIAVWETVAGLANQYAISIPVARLNVAEFIRVAEIDIAPIGASQLEFALDAYDKATPRIERCTSVWSCTSADFDPGLDTRTHGAAGPEKPSAFARAGRLSAEFPAHSLLARKIPCAGKKIPCSVYVGNSPANH